MVRRRCPPPGDWPYYDESESVRPSLFLRVLALTQGHSRNYHQEVEQISFDPSEMVKLFPTTPTFPLLIGLLAPRP